MKRQHNNPNAPEQNLLVGELQRLSVSRDCDRYTQATIEQLLAGV